MTDELTQRMLETRVASAAERGECPPYIPAFHGNREQLDLKSIPIDDLAGKRVLDVGCNLGLRCFQAVAAGASAVVGMDVNPTRIAQARALAAELELEVDFLCGDADLNLVSSKFDVVVCAGVLEHSRDPFALIGKLAEATSEILVLETEGPTGIHASEYLSEVGVIRKVRGMLSRLPIVFVGRNGPNPVRVDGRFYFSRSALGSVCRFHQPVFGDVVVVPAPVAGRHIAVARRRSVGHLVVISGASGAGKSTFLKGLSSAEQRRLLEPIGLEDLSEWVMVSASRYHDAPARMERLCLHYDMNRSVRYPTKMFARDDALDLIRVADEVTFLTLWADTAVILERKSPWMAPEASATSRHRGLVAGLMKGVRVLRHGRARPPRDVRLRDRQRWDISFLSHPGALASLYDAWFTFCGSIERSREYVIQLRDDRYILQNRAEWQRLEKS